MHGAQFPSSLLTPHTHLWLFVGSTLAIVVPTRWVLPDRKRASCASCLHGFLLDRTFRLPGQSRFSAKGNQITLWHSAAPLQPGLACFWTLHSRLRAPTKTRAHAPAGWPFFYFFHPRKLCVSLCPSKQINEYVLQPCRMSLLPARCIQPVPRHPVFCSQNPSPATPGPGQWCAFLDLWAPPALLFIS